MRREAEEQLEQERIQLEQERIQREAEIRSRLLAEQKLEQERIQAQENLAATAQSIALKMIQGNLPLEQISQFTGLTIEKIQQLRAENQ
jgi:hypothetical protein